MASNSAVQSQGSELDALASIMKLLTGTTQTQTTSGGGQTTQTQMSPEVMAGLLKSALEGNQGLAATTQGQRTAGLYNSSTNRLLANDLLSRLTARTAEVGAPKVTTTAPQTTTTKTPSALGGNDMLAKLMLGMTAYSKLTGKKPGEKSVLDSLLSEGKDLGAMLGIGTNIPTADMISANLSADPIAALNASQGWTGQAEALSALPSTMSEAPVVSMGAMSADAGAPMASYTGANGYGDIMADSFSGFTAEQVGTAPPASEFYVPTEEEYSNFSSAPAAANQATQAAGASQSLTSLGSGAGASAMSLYSGISALTDANSQNDAAGAISTASGAYGAYKSYQAYEAYQAAQAAKAAADAASAASTASSAASTASTAASAAEGAEAASAASGSGGSVLGYIGPIMDAIYAEKNPKGAQNEDYRRAVGGAILNYFGFGWATPIVDEVAKPVLNAAMDAGTESMGTFGAVLADPVGAPLSGQYEVDDLALSTLDPANLFGGNPGGSVGSVFAAGIDPIGAALGDTGVFAEVKDFTNSITKPVTDFFSDIGDDLGCFLTTACMRSKMAEFKDDCRELTVMRQLRDDYVAELPEGREVIKHYYATAPHIVSGINARKDHRQVWNTLYSRYLLPAVVAYEAGDKADSYSIYLEMVDWAEEQSTENRNERN